MSRQLHARKVRLSLMRQIRDAQEGVDLSQVRARMYEERAVDVLIGLAEDPFVDPDVRRKCAVDVRVIARGLPALIGSENEPPLANPPLVEIENVRAANSQFMAQLALMNLPPEEWPDELRSAAEKAVNEEL